MAKLTTSDLVNLQNETTAVSTLNSNFALVETAMENTLSRDGTSPNTMSASLDMNSNRITNLIAAVSDAEPVRKAEFDDLQDDVDATLAAAVAAAVAAGEASASTSATNAASSASAAATSATTATTQASNASTSASNASTSASNASTSASNASSSASAASSSASSASTSASTATTQASNAAASAASALANSESAVVQFTFDTSTTDADPGSGDFRFNNATVASVTEIYFDNLDRSGNTITGWLDAFDDSTATNKGFLYIRQANDPTTYGIFNVTGSVVDGTGYRKVTVTNIAAGAGSFDSAAISVVEFSRSGDSQAVDFASTAEVTSANNDQLLFFDTSGANAVKRDDVASVVLAGIASAAIAPTTIELGHASDTTVSRSASGIIAVEGVPVYSQIPQNSQSAAYTTVLADAQKHILHPTADNNARVFTIDSNANVAYPVGTVLTFVNQINTVTISITADTLTLAGTGSTGSRTLAANGIATALKLVSTSWIISGTGLT